MGKFKRVDTPIQGLYIIEPTVFGDSRGFFMESWNKKEFEEIGINCNFVQDNHSKSKKGVLRGLHFQIENVQSKLVRCIRGKIIDIAVDLRKNSPTFGKYFSVELSEENRLMFFIPKYFAHGFLVVSDEAEVIYKVDEYYDPKSDSGIIWNDETLKIDWQLEKYGINENELIISEKDKKLKTFKEFINSNIWNV
ncbi:dTDP-4-dehydrorhamnose 3,5-epimerase [Thermosipho africanus Ob7]|jgi:dTDP-4-dehydrorhamnose 3,5-epimerase|uniref:dTDP-4-dehydrorhamnose 3,5-epimerase n=1 Tax=Thermosipho africanus TaxID=2421 RepID=UPI000E0C824D|nr:dTDP-4-dehydrorhamnose 3,5-epimerase [Thermosipho africanus]RDI90818.1 dTDP-4-dehydrorhamnose 3,5-epimerase [Thermosipho africanus Ob7]